MAGVNCRMYVFWQVGGVNLQGQGASSMKQKVVVVKPLIDNRYSQEKVVAHNGSEVHCIPLAHAEEIVGHVDDTCDVVAIDEVQFFLMISLRCAKPSVRQGRG